MSRKLHNLSICITHIHDIDSEPIRLLSPISVRVNVLLTANGVTEVERTRYVIAGYDQYEDKYIIRPLFGYSLRKNDIYNSKADKINSQLLNGNVSAFIPIHREDLI